MQRISIEKQLGLVLSAQLFIEFLWPAQILVWLNVRACLFHKLKPRFLSELHVAQNSQRILTALFPALARRFLIESQIDFFGGPPCNGDVFPWRLNQTLKKSLCGWRLSVATVGIRFQIRPNKHVGCVLSQREYLSFTLM